MRITKENIITTKEKFGEIEIVLSNGKIMYVDFYNNTIMRYNPAGKGCEQYREFHSNTDKMIQLCNGYLKNQK